MIVYVLTEKDGGDQFTVGVTADEQEAVDWANAAIGNDYQQHEMSKPGSKKAPPPPPQPPETKPEELLTNIQTLKDRATNLNDRVKRFNTSSLFRPRTYDPAR